MWDCELADGFVFLSLVSPSYLWGLSPGGDGIKVS